MAQVGFSTEAIDDMSLHSDPRSEEGEDTLHKGKDRSIIGNVYDIILKDSEPLDIGYYTAVAPMKSHVPSFTYCQAAIACAHFIIIIMSPYY